MACIGVFENGTRLCFALKRILGALANDSVVVKLAQNDGVYDTMLIGTPPPENCDCFTAKTLIVPDCMDANQLPPAFSESIISYGLRSKNTVTASSLIGTRLVVSIQRSIPTVSGGTVGEQEIIVTVNCIECSDEILGIIAALLTLDIPPEKIAKLSFDI